MPPDVTTAPAGKDSFPAARLNEPSLSSLVSGILDDVQKLIENQFTLLKLDLHKDVERVREAGILLGLGIGLLLGAGLLLLFMLVYLLAWLTEPYLALWVCYAIVGGVVAVIGAAVLFMAKQKFDALKIVPEETTQGLKENLQWKTNPN
jgi:tetrahydromethanopterin S-methyltransferase subunit G